MLGSCEYKANTSHFTSNTAKSGGGFTCCVPSCFNNDKRKSKLSSYNFPYEKKKGIKEAWKEVAASDFPKGFLS